MAVQVPTIKRNAPMAEESVGRMNFEAPSNEAGAIVARAGEKLVGAAVNYYEQEQDFAADTAANAAVLKYTMAQEDALDGPNGARRFQGDPNEAFAQYDEKVRKAKDEVLMEYGTGSDRVRKAVEAKLSRVDQTYYVKKTTAYGAQTIAYEDRITDGIIEQQKTEMTDAAGLIVAGEPQSLVHLDVAVRTIQDARLKTGEKRGSVKRDEAGNYIPDPSVQMQLQKDLSEGLMRTIETLNADGSVEEAKMVQERYMKYLTPQHRKSVLDSTEKATFEQKSYKEWDRIKNMPEGRAMQEIEKISDPKIKEKVGNLRNSWQAHLEAGKERQSKANMNGAIKAIMDIQAKDPNALLTAEDVRNHKDVKKWLPGIRNAKQLQSVFEQVEAPKNSKQESVGDMFDLMNKGFRDENGDIIDGETFLENTNGLSKADKTFFRSQYAKFSTPSESKKAAAVKDMNKTIENNLLRLGVVTKDSNTGRYSNEELKIINEARRNFLMELPDGYEQWDPKKRQEAVDKYAASMAKDKAFPAATPPIVIPSRPAREPIVLPKKSGGGLSSVVSTGVDIPVKTPETLRRAATEKWKAKNGGRVPKTPAELAEIRALMAEGK